MRVAVLILGLALSLLVLLQSCAMFVGGAAFGEATTSQAGLVGFALAFFWVVGAAFALGKPTVSCGVFLFAGLVGLGASVGLFQDLRVWAVVSLILAVFSWLGRRETRKPTQAEKPPAPPST